MKCNIGTRTHGTMEEPARYALPVTPRMKGPAQIAQLMQPKTMADLMRRTKKMRERDMVGKRDVAAGCGEAAQEGFWAG